MHAMPIVRSDSVELSVLPPVLIRACEAHPGIHYTADCSNALACVPTSRAQHRDGIPAVPEPPAAAADPLQHGARLAMDCWMADAAAAARCQGARHCRPRQCCHSAPMPR